MKTILVIGAGASDVPELAWAADRDHWSIARRTFTGWEGRGRLAQALAREDGWAVVVPFSWRLVDAMDVCPAVLSWDEVTLPVARPAAPRAEQGDLFGRRA